MWPTPEETAAILCKRATDAREQELAHAEGVRRIVVQLIREQVKPPAKVWLIGSLAWGGFGVRSDVDIVASDLDRALALQIEVSVARAAGAEVDLLNFDDLPTSFQERVLKSGLSVV